MFQRQQAAVGEAQQLALGDNLALDSVQTVARDIIRAVDALLQIKPAVPGVQSAVACIFKDALNPFCREVIRHNFRRAPGGAPFLGELAEHGQRFKGGGTVLAEIDFPAHAHVISAVVLYVRRIDGRGRGVQALFDASGVSAFRAVRALSDGLRASAGRQKRKRQ